MTVKDILEEIPHMTYQELLDFRVSVSAKVETEILNRRSGPMEGWKCDVCHKTFGVEDVDECISHVRTAHRYTLEDAKLATSPTYK